MLKKSFGFLFISFLLTFLACSQKEDIGKYLERKVSEINERYEKYESIDEFGIKEGKEKLEDVKLCLENGLFFVGVYLSGIAETYIDNGVRINIGKKNKENFELFSKYWNGKKSEIEKLLGRYKKLRNEQNNSFLKGEADIKALKAERYFEYGKYWLEMNNCIYSSMYTSRGVLYANRAVDYLNLSPERKTEVEINIKILKEEYDKFGKILVDDYSSVIKGEGEIYDYISPGAEISLGKKFIEKNFLFPALIELLSITESYYLVKMKESKTVPDIGEYEKLKSEIDERFKKMSDKDLSIGEFFREKGEFYFVKYEKNKVNMEYLINSYVIYQKVLPLFFKIIEPDKIIITFVRWPFE